MIDHYRSIYDYISSYLYDRNYSIVLIKQLSVISDFPIDQRSNLFEYFQSI